MSRILLGVTGSIAAIKTPEMYAALRAAGHEVKVAPTATALAFFEAADLIPDDAPVAPDDPLLVRGQTTVYMDQDEWPQERLFHPGEPVLHIELRRWADVLLMAPLDANTLAKLALGLCDNLLTCVYRAWDFSRPVVLAPAMNTLMWENPATMRHLRQLLDDHGGRMPSPVASATSLCEMMNIHCPLLRVVPPVTKVLYCGDEGVGGMADIASIVACIGALAHHGDRETRS